MRNQHHMSPVDVILTLTCQIIELFFKNNACFDFFNILKYIY